MIAVWTSTKQFVKGPVWAGAGIVTGTLSVLGIFASEQFWTLMFFAALASVGAAFYSFHRERVHAEVQAKSLESRIDALMREGFALQERLAKPPEDAITASQEDGTVTYRLGPDRERKDRAADFDDRIQEVLAKNHPALVYDYLESANDKFRKWRASHEVDEKGNLRMSIEEFTTMLHTEPAMAVGASLQGLRAARNRLS